MMINGIINVYKEPGFTSFDVVAKLRGITHIRKIGHTGTLDPDATGVLPVCFGSATKLCDMLTDRSKEYEAGFVLGITTDTQDTSGKILAQKEVDITKTELEQIIMSFVGKIEQIPPMYSAIKVDGQRLYELARKGVEVERKAREVEIHNIDVVDITQISFSDFRPDIRPKEKSEKEKNESVADETYYAVDITKETFYIKIRVGCSKGTYIRTLVHDIGQKCGCGAAMCSLKRTRSGEFKIKDSLTLKEIEKLMQEEKIEDAVVNVDHCFMEWPALIVKGEEYKRVSNGNYIRSKNIGEKIRIYDEKNSFMALYKFDREDKKYIPEKMFLS